MNKRAWPIGLMLLLLVLVAAAVYRNGSAGYLDRPYQKDKLVLDTLVTIKAYGKDQAEVEKAVSLAIKEIETVDRGMDYYDPKSAVSKINKSAAGTAGTPVSAPSGLIEVIETSKELNRLSGGAFDITVGPLVKAWDFAGKPHVPSEEQLSNALSLVDMENVEVNKDKKTVSLKRPGMRLDLGGVAKGYAADKAIAVLKRRGIKSALVTTGSTTVVLGKKADGKPWLIGIQDPRTQSKTLGTLELSDESISTSGDYQRFFKQDGKRYHHILNPKTGRPARGCRSVTILTKKSCTEADILSTAVFVMGYPNGLEFIEEMKDTVAVIFDSPGRVHVTEGLHLGIW